MSVPIFFGILPIMDKSYKIISTFCCLLAFWACGDDNGSSSTDECSDCYSSSSSPSSSDSKIFDGYDNYQDSSAMGTPFKSELGSVSIIKEEVKDTRSGKIYKTIKFGPYVWMAENVNDDARGTKSICYDEKSSNCKSYGRLYMDQNVYNACPEGFDVPSEEDFKYMTRFASDITNEDFGFNPQMGGSCTETKGSLTCTNIGQAAEFLTSDGKFIRIKKNGGTSFEEIDLNGYYSLRCMKHSYFVETEKMLPTCTTETTNLNDNFFVADKKTNYTCKNGKWVNTKDSECPYSENGRKYYYKDSLYICNSSWELASMNDLDEPCTKTNERTVQKLNGKNYICENKKWRLPNKTEEKIGFCTPQNTGTLDSILTKSDTSVYYCDATGWRKAVITDFIGKCDSSKYYVVKEYNDDSYVCRTTKQWSKLDTVENKIGVCTPKLAGKMDSVITKKDSTRNVKIYYCDTTAWRAALVSDIYGKCDSSKHYKIVKFSGDSYSCRQNNKWEILTKVEQEIGLCTPNKKGTLDTTDSKQFYYCDSTGWRNAVADDYLGVCDSANKYKVKYFWGNHYGCKNGPKWEYLEYPESDLGYCVPEVKGVVKIDQNATSYICDTKWRKATKEEALGECTDENDGKTNWFKPDKKDIKYICAWGSWRESRLMDDSLGICAKAQLKKSGIYNSKEYICTKDGWSVATLITKYDSCTVERDNELVTFEGERYVCQDKRWVKVTGIEAKYGLCTANRENELVKDTSINYIYTYACINNRWKSVSGVEAEYGICTEKRENEIVQDKEYNYMCHNKSWKSVFGIALEKGFCTKEREGEIVASINSEYIYKCEREDWKTVSAPELFGNCTADNAGTIETIDSVKFICSKDKVWELYSGVLEEYGECNCDNRGKTVTYNGKKYGCGGTTDCKRSQWLAFDEITEALGFCDGTKIIWTVYNNKDYVCGTNEKGWISSSNNSIFAMYGACNKRYLWKYGALVGFKGQHYYCDEDLADTDDIPGWHPLNAIDSLGGVCTKGKMADTVTYQGTLYYCGLNTQKKYEWLQKPND